MMFTCNQRVNRNNQFYIQQQVQQQMAKNKSRYSCNGLTVVTVAQNNFKIIVADVTVLVK